MRVKKDYRGKVVNFFSLLLLFILNVGDLKVSIKGNAYDFFWLPKNKNSEWGKEA